MSVAEAPPSPSRAARWSDPSSDALRGCPLLSDPTGLTGKTVVWLTLSLVFAATCGILGLVRAFRTPYVVQDDARTFLFWMERVFDPALFPHDLMADYFSAVSPPAYTALHWIAAGVFGIDPFFLNKLLPTALGLITTAYAFLLSLRLFRVPAAAFAATTILNESLWMADAIPSGTPRAFIYPIFVAFLYYFTGRRFFLSLCAVALLGQFYPQFLTLALGTIALSLCGWEHGRPTLSRDRRLYMLLGSAGLVSAFIVGWATSLSSPYGPVVTADQARRMLEFSYGSRTYFFIDDWWMFWVVGERSGVFPFGFRPPPIFVGLLLPVLLRFPARFPLVREISPATNVLARLTVASLGMYAAAHLLLFRLHLPSRYTQHSLRIVLALAAGMVLLIMLDALWRRLADRGGAGGLRRTVGLAASGAVVLGAVVLYPAAVWATGMPFPKTQYVEGLEEGLYSYLAGQPKDILIASLTRENDLLPTFARRSILTGFEYGIPYHTAYYGEIRRRTHELVRAQYTTSPNVVRQFIEKYHVDFWLLHRSSYLREYILMNRWIMQTQPEAMAALANLDQPVLPVVAQLADRCAAYQGVRVILLDARCMRAVAESDEPEVVLSGVVPSWDDEP